MIRSRSTIKNWFKTGLKPTQEQFWDWLDSFWHKNDELDASDINGMQTLLDQKIDVVEKGVSVATLEDGKVPGSQLPEIAITDVIESVENTLANFIANEWSAGLMQIGDVVQITTAAPDSVVDLYILYQNDGDQEADYKKIDASKIDWSNVLNKPDLIQRSEVGAANGVAPLGADSKVPAANLPDIGGGSGSALPLKPATITVWATGDYRDNQVKKTIAAYYDNDTKHLEQRFDWNTDLSVSRIEIKDELTGVWVQRDYTWTAGIPAVSETNITAWTII